MDIYSETLVKKKLSDKDKSKVKIIFASIIISSMVFILGIPALALKIGIPFVSTASLLIFIGLLIWFKHLLNSMQIEYEYIITNGTLDFDKIIAKKKRRRIISVELQEIEEIGLYDERNFRGSNFNARINVARMENSVENFYIIYNHPTEKRVLVVFKPDASMLSNLKKLITPRLSRSLPDSL